MKFLAIIADRLCEPSTWAGMGPFITGIVWNIWPEHWQPISGAAFGFCGLMAMILRGR